jgi:ATP-dependent protease ClpP protease subunit
MVRYRLLASDGKDDRNPSMDSDYICPVVFDKESMSIDLFGSINTRTVLIFKSFLEKLIRLGVKKSKGSCITVNINSNGGASTQGFAIYDLINTCPVRTRTVSMGVTHSAALLPFLGGIERWAHENAFFLMHKVWHEPPEAGTRYSTEDFYSFGRNSRIMDERMAKIILANSKMTPAQLKKHQRRDTYIDAEEAKRLGLIHRIIKA